MSQINAGIYLRTQVDFVNNEACAMETNRDYHIRRAREELDLAYRSDRRTVAAVHVHLSALHMARLRSLAIGQR